jgi:glycosyltransferase involved in cell wall biosynthesis
VQAGQAFVQSHFSWDHVAQRTRDAVSTVRRLSSDKLRLPTIGVVSTWNVRCGIAMYARSLVSGLAPERLRVFAGKATDLVGVDEAFVRRCWAPGWEDPLLELFQELCDADVDAVLFQFNFGFHRLQALGRLIDRLHQRGILVFITLHSTMDIVRPNLTISLAEIRPSLAKLARILVHSVHDLNYLKASGLVDNVALFPMGVPNPFDGDRTAVRRSLGWAAGPLIASFGYLLPHKGLRELIRAFASLRSAIPDAHLLLLNALYPGEESESEMHACQNELHRLELEDSTTFITHFLTEAEIIDRLAAADVVVYPYQHTQESASAAVKIGLASLTPVAVTPLPIFADIAPVSYALPGTTPNAIAEGLLSLLGDPALRADLIERQRRWVAAHDWQTLSARLDGLIRGELLARRIAESGCFARP